MGTLQSFGFLGNNLRAAAELAWKILSGKDCDLQAAAKGVFKPPGQGFGVNQQQWDQSVIPWYVLKFHGAASGGGKQKVCDGDRQVESRSRLHDFHNQAATKRITHGLSAPSPGAAVGGTGTRSRRSSGYSMRSSR